MCTDTGSNVLLLELSTFEIWKLPGGTLKISATVEASLT